MIACKILPRKVNLCAMNSIIIGISGPSASGKTLLANTLVNEMGRENVLVISEDAYYKDNSHLPKEKRALINYDHPDSFDHDLLCEHLVELQKGNSINTPIYDYTEHLRKQETKHFNATSVIIIEGILLLAVPKVRELMDIKIFMNTSLDICLIRRLKRDITERGRSLESVLNQYQNTVRPMYWQFIEPSNQHADLIVPRGGENRIAIDMLKAKLRELV